MCSSTIVSGRPRGQLSSGRDLARGDGRFVGGWRGKWRPLNGVWGRPAPYKSWSARPDNSLTVRRTHHEYCPLLCLSTPRWQSYFANVARAKVGLDVNITGKKKSVSWLYFMTVYTRPYSAILSTRVYVGPNLVFLVWQHKWVQEVITYPENRSEDQYF